MSFHATDWLSTLLALLGTAVQAKNQGATPQETQSAVISAGLAIATHVLSATAPEPSVTAQNTAASSGTIAP